VDVVGGSDPDEDGLHRKGRSDRGTAVEKHVDLTTGRNGDVFLGVEESFGVEVS
jgi:hypothetical protein